MGNLIADTSGANEAKNERRCGRLMTGADLAMFLGYSAASIEAWLRDGMPCKRPGSKGVAHRYDSAQVVQWLIRREVARAVAELQARYGISSAGMNQADKTSGDAAVGGEGETPPLAGAGGVLSASYKDRLGMARAKQAELDIALAEGRVVEIATVERVLSNLAVGIKTQMLSIPAQIAQALAGISDEAEVRRRLDEEIGRALTEISQVEPAAFLSEQAAELVGERE